jgi:alkylated DNA repair dioxygenase AlkB
MDGPVAMGSLWLGLTVDHRVLFEGLQDDWLRPREGTHGYVLGRRAFPVNRDELAEGHRILVRIKLDPTHLPRLPVYRLQAGEWALSSVLADGPGDSPIFWPGVIPTFAISDLLVSSDEERARLAGLARQVSNVALPSVPRTLRPGKDLAIPPSALPPEPRAGIELPAGLDAVRGSIAMGMWAIPRVEPWADLLCKSFGPNAMEELPSLAGYLHSPWWVAPPWIRRSPQLPLSGQEHLWLAAIRVFSRARAAPQLLESDLVQQIVEDAGRTASDDDLRRLGAWADETNLILRGNTRLELKDWKLNPVSKAIQLVLARPDPSSFAKWKDDLPSLPPTIWFSAAALCGLVHGYRRLPMSFRGDVEQRRLFAIYALHALGPAPLPENWAALVRAAPEWHRDSGDIVFSWSRTVYARKAEHARAKWFTSDLEDIAVRKSAEEISRANRWPCVTTRVIVPGCEVPFSGESVEVIAGPPQHLAMKGRTEFTLPPDAVFEPILDPKEFRRCIVTEGATVPIPGPPQRILPTAVSIEVPKPIGVPGLAYVREFLTEAQQADLIAIIDKGEWNSELRRRVQHFGWRYDYKTREIDMSMRLGPLPPWASALAERLNLEGLLPHVPDQVIVNEYVENQGISRHIDCVPCFDDGVAMISLLESWEMIFQKKGEGTQVAKLLEDRSVTVMSGDARYQWSHEIPARYSEPTGLRRQRRVSVTFRKVKVSDTPRLRESRGRSRNSGLPARKKALSSPVQVKVDRIRATDPTLMATRTADESRGMAREIDVQLRAHEGGIVVAARQVQDGDKALAARITVVDIRTFQDGKLITSKQFHSNEGRFLYHAIQLRRVVGTEGDLHYGDEGLWWLVYPMKGKQSVQMYWPDRPIDHGKQLPPGRYCAALEIWIGEKSLRFEALWEIDAEHRVTTSRIERK